MTWSSLCSRYWSAMFDFKLSRPYRCFYGSPFCTISAYSKLFPKDCHFFVLVFLSFFLDSKQIFFFLVFNFMPGSPIPFLENNTWGKRRYGIFQPFFNSISLKSAQWFPQAKKRKKLGPCMNVFLNFDPYSTLDLFHPKRWLRKRSNIKEIET